jgi:hypothetical protein
MRLICEICSEFIGEVSLEGVTAAAPSPGDINGRAAIEALKRPIRGSMIGSPDPFHDFPRPFDPSATWEFMFCPYSNRTHRPFTATEEPRQLLTHKGMIDIPEAIEPVEVGVAGTIKDGKIIETHPIEKPKAKAPAAAPKPAAKKKGK